MIDPHGLFRLSPYPAFLLLSTMCRLLPSGPVHSSPYMVLSSFLSQASPPSNHSHTHSFRDFCLPVAYFLPDQPHPHPRAVSNCLSTSPCHLRASRFLLRRGKGGWEGRGWGGSALACGRRGRRCRCRDARLLRPEPARMLIKYRLQAGAHRVVEPVVCRGALEGNGGWRTDLLQQGRRLERPPHSPSVLVHIGAGVAQHFGIDIDARVV